MKNIEINAENKKLFFELANTNSKNKDAIIEKIYNANLKLVESIIHNYCSKNDLFYDDYSSEGNIALIKAINNFDQTRQYQFSTYAHFKIEGAIINALKRYSKTIKIPKEKISLKTRIQRVIEDIKSENSGIYSIEDVWGVFEHEITRDKFNEAINFVETVSNEKSDFDSEEKYFNESNLIDNVETSDDLGDLLEKLDSRERKIFCMNLGINGYIKYKKIEIAKEFKISPSSISRILKDIDRKIKNLRKRKS